MLGKMDLIQAVTPIKHALKLVSRGGISTVMFNTIEALVRRHKVLLEPEFSLNSAANITAAGPQTCSVLTRSCSHLDLLLLYWLFNISFSSVLHFLAQTCHKLKINTNTHKRSQLCWTQRRIWCVKPSRSCSLIPDLSH